MPSTEEMAALVEGLATEAGRRNLDSCRNPATVALGQIPPGQIAPHADALVRAMAKSLDQRVRCDAAEVLGQLESATLHPHAGALLKAMVEDSHHLVQSNAVKALGKLEPALLAPHVGALVEVVLAVVVPDEAEQRRLDVLAAKAAAADFKKRLGRQPFGGLEMDGLREWGWFCADKLAPDGYSCPVGKWMRRVPIKQRPPLAVPGSLPTRKAKSAKKKAPPPARSPRGKQNTAEEEAPPSAFEAREAIRMYYTKLAQYQTARKRKAKKAAKKAAATVVPEVKAEAEPEAGPEPELEPEPEPGAEVWARAELAPETAEEPESAAATPQGEVDAGPEGASPEPEGAPESESEPQAVAGTVQAPEPQAADAGGVAPLTVAKLWRLLEEQYEMIESRGQKPNDMDKGRAVIKLLKLLRHIVLYANPPRRPKVEVVSITDHFRAGPGPPRCAPGPRTPVPVRRPETEPEPELEPEEGSDDEEEADEEGCPMCQFMLRLLGLYRPVPAAEVDAAVELYLAHQPAHLFPPEFVEPEPEPEPEKPKKGRGKQAAAAKPAEDDVGDPYARDETGLAFVTPEAARAAAAAVAVADAAICCIAVLSLVGVSTRKGARVSAHVLNVGAVFLGSRRKGRPEDHEVRGSGAGKGPKCLQLQSTWESPL